MVTFPVERDRILVRLINLADLFDGPAKNMTVDIEKVAAALFKEANRGGSASADNCLTGYAEKTLSGNMNLDSLAERKIHWKTVDDRRDGETLSKAEDESNDVFVFSLWPQQAKVFEIDFICLGELFLQ